MKLTQSATASRRMIAQECAYLVSQPASQLEDRQAELPLDGMCLAMPPRQRIEGKLGFRYMVRYTVRIYRDQVLIKTGSTGP